MKELWRERSVGIKLWGFEENPYDLSKKINMLSDANAKGEPHGLKNTYPENQIHIIKIMDEDDSWGDSLEVLIEELGGVKEIKKLVNTVKPKNYFIIINKPISDFEYQQSNDLSKESVKLLNELDCNVSINFF